MPALPAVPLEDLQAAFKERKDEIFDVNTNKFHGPSHKCWSALSQDLNNRINSKYAYTIATGNRYGIADTIGVTKDTQERIKSADREKISDDDYETPENTCNPQILDFQIEIPLEKWNVLFQTVEYNRKQRNSTQSYGTLKKFEWTHYIQTQFYDKTCLPCAISFKRCTVHSTGIVFLKMEGNCNCCSSMFYGAVNEPPPSDSSAVIIHCTYRGEFQTCVGGKKRLLSEEMRKYYRDKMMVQNIAPSTVRKFEAKESMEYGKPEPAHIPSNSALRSMKWKEGRDTEIHEWPITGLSVLKGVFPYDSVIHDIGYDKFFVHYWSSTEINNYRLYCRRNKTSRISIDATGHVVQNMKLPSNRKTSAIFLYEMVVHDYKNNCQFAVSHMISEKHDNNSIAYWILEWLRNNDIKPPNIVVTDMSLALMMGVIRGFTQYSTLQKYLEICADLLQGKNYIDIPTTMLRTDFAHVMHLIASWPEIKNSARRVKQFYLHSIALIIGCQDYIEIKNLLRYTFTVALYEEDGMNANGNANPCEEAKNFLKYRIAGFKKEEPSKDEIIEDEKTYPDNDIVDVLDHSSAEGLPFLEEIQNMFDQCKLASSLDENKGHGDNMHCNEKIATKILKLCKLLPIWSAVMVPYFGYGDATESSSAVEGNFNDTKNRTFQHKKLPIRADEFLRIHIDSILGNMNLIRANVYKDEVLFQDDTYQGKKKYDGDVNEEIRNNSSLENWRGEALPLKKRRLNYLTPNPTLLKTNDRSLSKSKVIGILKNGNLFGLKSVKIDDKWYSLRNTCPFDSIAQILFGCYADSLNYQKFVDRNSKKFKLFELVANGIRDGITVQTYRKRALILKRFYEAREHADPTILTLNCQDSAFNVSNNLFRRSPSAKITEKCPSCNHVQQFAKRVVTIYVTSGMLTNFNETLMDELFGKALCKKCGSVTHSETKLANHVLIELAYTMNVNIGIKDVSCSLSSIPKDFRVGRKHYKLRGAVEFIDSITRSTDSIGHYVAYVYRQQSFQWERHCDMNPSSATMERPSAVLRACQILMYTE